MTPVIDTIWFNEGFGRYAAIAALADALPKEEAAKYRTARLDRLRSIVASAPDFLQRMSLDELSREGSFLYGDDFRVGMNLFSRGALMAAEMDDRIRAQTSNQKSLRDALRYLMAWTAQKSSRLSHRRAPRNFSPSHWRRHHIHPQILDAAHSTRHHKFLPAPLTSTEVIQSW